MMDNLTTLMHGAIAFCMKHGHDWKTEDTEIEGNMLLTHVRCLRCGVNHIIATWRDDE